MIIRIAIFFILLSGAALAQSPLLLKGKVLQLDTANGEVVQRWSKIDTGNMAPGFNILPDTTSHSLDFLRGDLSWQTVSGSGIPAFPNDSTLFLRGDSTWSAVSGGSPYFKDDGGTPVRAPSVTAGTKGIAIGDSAVASGWRTIAFGNGAIASGDRSLTIGNKEEGSNSGAASPGNDAIAIGNSTEASSFGSITIGWSALDFQSSQINNGYHGQNIALGVDALTGSNANNSIAIGYSSECDKNNSIAIGNSAIASDSCEIIIGENAASGLNRRFQISIGTFPSGTGNTSAFDSTTQIYGPTTARNTFEYLFGRSNTTATGILAVFADGAHDGNASTFDCLQVAKNGTITAGKNFVAGASLGSSTTPTAGTYAKDNAIIAWGDVNADSTFNGLQYGNFTITHPATGQYVITLPTVPTHAICVVTLTGSTLGLSAASSIAGAAITIATGVGAVATDESFNFIVTGRP